METELTGVKSKLGVLSAELKTAKDELARLEGNAEAKARGYENFKQLKADHDAYLAEQQRLQALKDKEDAIRKAGGEVNLSLTQLVKLLMLWMLRLRIKQ